jgi:hypothetical protein
MSSRSYSLNSNYDNGHGKEVSKLLDDAVKSTLTLPGMANASASPSSMTMEIEKFNQDSSGLYIRHFLISSKENKRGWSVSEENLRQRALSAVGKPVILYKDPESGLIDHYPWNTKFSAEANSKQQNKYKIGEVKKIFYDAPSNAYFCDSLITDPKAIDFINSFHSKKINLPVSPQVLYHNDGVNIPDKHYVNYDFSHVAIVDARLGGAYGPDARVIGTCSGKAEECHKKLPQQVAPLAAVASASSCTSDSPDPAYPYFPAPTRYHAILNNIVDDAVAAARALGMGIAIASSESDTSEPKSESADASTHRLRRVYEVPRSYAEKLQAPSNGKPRRRLA